jgi:hypothetical protein
LKTKGGNSAKYITDRLKRDAADPKLDPADRDRKQELLAAGTKPALNVGAPEGKTNARKELNNSTGSRIDLSVSSTGKQGPDTHWTLAYHGRVVFLRHVSATR